eukprot:TRINITY_DN9013_c0_g1_i9.p1 TRINITY_DN9013_c0_g1~~TRINITY_DN9013_c0_g1_i9.p1  ORF type:complete len:1008 (+),score=211.71 TRINITY_DN9013_c0_g1_i9:203-3226(+)
MAIDVASAATKSLADPTPRVVWYPVQNDDDWVPCSLLDWPAEEDAPATLGSRGGRIAVAPSRRRFVLPPPRLDENLPQGPWCGTNGAAAVGSSLARPSATAHAAPGLVAGECMDVAGISAAEAAASARSSAPADLEKLAAGGIGAAHIEEALRLRFCESRAYSRIGGVIVFVNPYRELPLYDDEHVELYAAMGSELPPHVYDTGAKVYKQLMEDETHQVIFLTGETCTGKTETCGHLLDFFIQTAGNDDLDERLRLLQPLLLPWVSVRTHSDANRSWLSTRALLSIHVDFDAEGFLCRASAAATLCELSRLAPEDEDWEGSGFEALRLAVLHRSASQWLGFREEFHLLGPFAETVGVRDSEYEASELEAWSQAMVAFRLDVPAVVRVLCGVLLLGELAASLTGMAEGKKELVDEWDDLLAAAAKTFGLGASELASSLPGPPPERFHALQHAARHVYKHLLDKILSTANDSLIGNTSPIQNAGVTIIEVPAWPDGDDAPSGFDGLALQWLNEAMRAELLSAALPVERARPVLERGHTLLSSAALLTALEELCGAIREAEDTSASDAADAPNHFRGPPPAPAAKEVLVRLQTWAKTSSGIGVRQRSRNQDSDSASHVEVELSGPCGRHGHRFDASFILGAQGAAAQAYAADARLLCDLLDASPVVRGAKEGVARPGSPASAEAASARPPSADVALGPELWGEPGIEGTLATITHLRTLLRPSTSATPWLVCCLRPNDKGAATVISRQIMLRQVKMMVLADMAHMARNDGYVHVWPVEAFERCLPMLEDALAGSDDEGAIGAECVYGTPALVDLLTTKEEEFQSQTAHRQSTDLLQLEKELALKERRVREERLRQDHMRKTLKMEWASEDHGVLHLPGGSRRVPTLPGEREPTRSMSNGRLAALHGALWQMAATLRTAKEEEVDLRASVEWENGEATRANQERERWRAETVCARRVYSHLRQQRDLFHETQSRSASQSMSPCSSPAESPRVDGSCTAGHVAPGTPMAAAE